MARVKAARAVRDEGVLERAERVSAGVMRILGMMKVIETLPDGRVREGMKAEVELQIAALKASTR